MPNDMDPCKQPLSPGTLTTDRIVGIDVMTGEDPVHDRDCPDCNVPMEVASVSAAGAAAVYVTTDRDGGLLDRLGFGESTALEAFVCPECGLTRLYADR